MRILVSRWPLDTLNLGSDSLLGERERKSGVISSELCSRKIPRILLCQMVRCGFVSQICSHMLGLKDVHKDLAEMKRKISFIALLLPRDRSFQKTLSYILHMGLRGLAWLDHVQGAGSAAPKAAPSRGLEKRVLQDADRDVARPPTGPLDQGPRLAKTTRSGCRQCRMVGTKCRLYNRIQWCASRDVPFDDWVVASYPSKKDAALAKAARLAERAGMPRGRPKSVKNGE